VYAARFDAGRRFVRQAAVGAGALPRGALVGMNVIVAGEPMNRFALVVDFQVKPEHLAKFNELIAVNAKASVGTEPGCRQFDVLRTLDDPCRVLLYEVYDSDDAFKTHLEQAHTKTFLGQVKELVTAQTVLKLARTVAPTKGG
jgi:autoinducer 2-degrading protein